MRVLVTGSSGLIGSALVPALQAAGHDVVRLVRAAPVGPGEVFWSPSTGEIDAASLAGVEGAVHLAGEGIGAKRWRPAQKERILSSRVAGTGLLATTLAGLSPLPSVLVSGSAIGYYGLRGDEQLTETSSRGTGFLADVVEAWEGAAAPAVEAGIRTVFLRSGIVLSSSGGTLAKLLPLFKLGLGGRLGPGTQWWSWVALEDEVGLILHALSTPEVAGPMNAVSPGAVTNAELTSTLATLLGRPALLPVPRFALSIALGGEMARELALAGQRVIPVVAERTGYRFSYRDLGSALAHVLAKRSSS